MPAPCNSPVIPGLVPGIHALGQCVGGRDKPGHDGGGRSIRDPRRSSVRVSCNPATVIPGLVPGIYALWAGRGWPGQARP
ncbi:hypothetical protein SLNSH_13830 [Alsobacter soli]|uniref:Uncharacterized protein n=1 Tax=Alsobacter soli TaxID=2109933 RepID=A0A2T1HRN6_9HYPH|nr:hypothetical protein SLNSH_13830 [Alsobacter soli]